MHLIDETLDSRYQTIIQKYLCDDFTKICSDEIYNQVLNAIKFRNNICMIEFLTNYGTTSQSYVLARLLVTSSDKTVFSIIGPGKAGGAIICRKETDLSVSQALGISWFVISRCIIVKGSPALFNVGKGSNLELIEIIGACICELI